MDDQMTDQRVSTPLVSIGLPTFNGARFLEGTLDALFAQDFTDFELIIGDNGSTDDTERICRRAAKDRRVRYDRSPTNRGAAWNYNRVLDVARGEYFKWAADDDVCLPTFLLRCIDELERAPTAVVAWPRTLLIDEHGDTIGELDDHDLEVRGADPVARLATVLRHRVEWHPVFGVMRTAALRRSQGIGAFVSADIALLAELALVGEFRQVPETLFLRRYHSGRSLVANASFEAHAAWYDPTRTRHKPVMPNLRLTRELLRRVAHAPVSPTKKVRASGAVLSCWAVPHWRHIGGEVKRALPLVGSR